VINDIALSSPDYHYLNYGYSRAVSGGKYEQVYRPFSQNGTPNNSGDKSRGAHA
jgi:hypothetical protein